MKKNNTPTNEDYIIGSGECPIITDKEQLEKLNAQNQLTTLKELEKLNQKK